MILVIDNYDSFTYNLVQLLAALGAEVRVERNDALPAAEALALRPAGIVISPGPGTPAEAGISGDVVRAAAEAGVPVLGVCLGHQVIAEVFGGRVCRAPRPVHGKTDEIAHDGSGLFAGIPSPFTATRYHSLCVQADSIAEPLAVQARTADGVIQGVRHRDLPVFGVQFHPESVLTPEGTKLLANFLDVCGEVSLERTADEAPAAIAAAGGSARSSARLAEVTTIGGAIARVSGGDSLDEAEARRCDGHRHGR
jgi:anthranilate synthase component 2